MCKVLNGKCGLEWECGKPQEGNRECADVVGSNKTTRVLIEVELRRGTPVGNVAKVWRQSSDTLLEDKIILFQAFSRYYPKKDTKRKNAVFVGQRMAKHSRVEYIPLETNYLPKKRSVGKAVMQGGGARRRHATQLAERVIKRLRKLI